MLVSLLDHATEKWHKRSQLLHSRMIVIISMISLKLDLTTCTEDEYVGVASHQLTGSARAWWDSFSDTRSPRPGSHHVGGVHWGFPWAPCSCGCDGCEGGGILQHHLGLAEGRPRVLHRFIRALEETGTKKKKMYFLKLEHACIKLRLSGQTCYTLREMIKYCGSQCLPCLHGYMKHICLVLCIALS